IPDRTTAAAAMSAGAAAVVGGTRFLLTDECHAHLRYKQRVCGASRTIVTTLFGLGWPLRHRVVPNAATERWLRSGREPAWMRYVCRASGVLGRVVPMHAASVAARRMSWMPPSAGAVLAGQHDSEGDLGPRWRG